MAYDRSRSGNEGSSSNSSRRPAGRRQYFRRRKVCKFCVEKIGFIDYKDLRLIGSFVAERGKILPRRLTGTCSPHQRELTRAIKQARNIALLPFAAEV
ncbi:MAG TPA: 30S ribosomal protein S18 [Terriglobia bacterium]|nr:30S ribosomal protein S18 [Terriglobia bacterium]